MSENISPELVIKKKRGRKKKSELEQLAKEKENENKIEETPVPKKRGRKPKGGKLTIKPILLNEDVKEQSLRVAQILQVRKRPAKNIGTKIKQKIF